MVIRNCRWIPSAGRTTTPQMFGTRNDGQHDFGYPCFMPREVTIDGLYVDDSNHPNDYQGLYYFSDPGGPRQQDPASAPFPYAHCQTLRVTKLTTASGKEPRICSDPRLAKSITLIKGDG